MNNWCTVHAYTAWQFTCTCLLRRIIVTLFYCCFVFVFYWVYQSVKCFPKINVRVYAIKKIKENKSINIKCYLDDFKKNWLNLTVLLFKFHDSVIQSIYNNFDWQFYYAIANQRPLAGPASKYMDSLQAFALVSPWVRSGFAFC
jgi:hypothetical protein